MTRTKFWVTLIVASIAVAIYLAWLDAGFKGDLFTFVMPRILGAATALSAIPALLVGVIALIARAFRHSITNATMFAIAGIVWLVLVAANINVALFERSIR